jgi:tRNA (cmo5U34)-methyltransferase
MDHVKEHFEEEATEFDHIIVTLIPDYAHMVDALVVAMPFDRTAAIRVIDLGCGTGTVALRVLDTFANAHVTCLDVAENMIAMARTKLAKHPQVRWRVGDFDTFAAEAPFDAVVSSLALHHLPTDGDKRRFYQRIYEVLNPGGAFYNADVVLASSESLQAAYIDRWRAFMSRGVSETEIDGNWLPKYYAEDRPAKLLDQLDWLMQAGFVDVDVVWKHYNFAVYGGVKRA